MSWMAGSWPPVIRCADPLEILTVEGGAVAIPAQQDALDFASVNICHGFGRQAKCLQPPEVID
jgi:hypothetical protein